MNDTLQRLTPTLNPYLVNVSQVATGFYYTLVLTTSRKVFSFGDGGFGALGLNDSISRSLPTLIPGFTDVASISTRYQTSFLITGSGLAYGWGANVDSQLGLGDQTARIVPTLIPSLTNVAQISAGQRHTLVLTTAGVVYGMGGNYNGRLGFNQTSVNIWFPTPIPGMSGIQSISAGADNSIVLTSIGTIFVFGGNAVGQLGLNDQQDRLVPTQNLFLYFYNCTQISAGFRYSLFLSGLGILTSGRNLGSGTNPTVPYLIGSLLGANVAATAGSLFSLALSSKGMVYGVGSNTVGQFGLNDGITRFDVAKNPFLSDI
jgi:alpha-tubulin suppressor-like RCC1 family protein